MSLATDSIEFTDYVKRNLCSYSEKIWSNYVTWWRNLWPSLLSWRSRCPRWRGRCTWRSPTCPGPAHSWTWGTSRSRCEWSAGSWRERLEWECYRGGESGGPVPRTARITDDDLIFLTLKTSMKISDGKSCEYSISCLVSECGLHFSRGTDRLTHWLEYAALWRTTPLSLSPSTDSHSQ